MKIGIFSNEYQKREVIERIFGILLSYPVEVYAQSGFYDRVVEYQGINGKINRLSDIDDFEGDIAFSIGGDGTFLKTVSLLQHKNIPILGVNTGRLGFLADVSCDDFEDTLAEILKGEYRVEERTRIKLSLNNDSSEVSYALNEVAILKQDLASMITVTMYINGEHVSSYESDGLIVATPTGSTAYSLSVGGAIMAPNTPNFIVTAIAPHSLTARPLVIGNDNVLTLEVKSRSNSFLVSMDGRSTVLSSEDTILKIERAEKPVCVVKRIGHTFYETLRNKLKWGVDPRQDVK
jgi:NAD+ kinase